MEGVCKGICIQNVALHAGTVPPFYYPEFPMEQFLHLVPYKGNLTVWEMVFLWPISRSVAEATSLW